MQYDFTVGMPIDELAIELIRAYSNPDKPFYGGFSGGVDSQCVYNLSERAGIKVDWYYNQSPIDPPQVPKFIKENYPDVKFQNFAQGFWGKHFMANGLPLRTQRWCCGLIKECGGLGRTKILGMRKEESQGRKGYKCFDDTLPKETSWLLPIINWTNDDRWQYLTEQGLTPNPLYKMGFNRTGCILCPFQGKIDVRLSLAYFPKIVNLWKLAANRYIKMRWERWSIEGGKNKRIKKPTFKTGEEYFNWWISR